MANNYITWVCIASVLIIVHGISIFKNLYHKKMHNHCDLSLKLKANISSFLIFFYNKNKKSFERWQLKLQNNLLKSG